MNEPRNPDFVRIGEANHFAKLNEEKVKAIREDKRVAKVVAYEYGMSIGAIKRIRQRKAWKHVA